MSYALFLLLGLAAGFAAAHFIHRSTLAHIQQQHRQALDSLQQQHQQALAAQQTQHQNAFQAQETLHQQAIASLQQTLGTTITHLQAEMKAATEDLLKKRQAEFTDLNARSMHGIVDPLNETLGKMKDAITQYSEKQSAFDGKMKTHIDTLIRQTETTRHSADELTRALKHDSKVQGDYGEAILDEILHKQGFTEGVHYHTQCVIKDPTGHALKDPEGAGLRPDIIFHLDTVRDVIIDSKVNLTDFINFANAEDPDQRRQHLDHHVESIRRQIRLLSQKNYAQYHDKTRHRMDYVIMFIPISAAWWEALRREPSLWREAMEQNVYIADEQTLFAALRIIKLTWTQIAQVDNQKKVFDLAAEMIDRVGQFIKHYEALGKALDTAQTTYANARRKLDPNGQSILVTTQKLLALGARDSKVNPVTPFLDVDDIRPLPEE